MYKKIMVYFILILSLAMTIMGIKTYLYTKGEYYRYVEKSLTDSAMVVANEIDSHENLEDLSTIKSLGHLSKVSEYRFTVIDQSGKVYFDTDKESELFESHDTRPEFKGAIEGKISVDIRKSTSLGEEMMYVAVPIFAEDTTIGVVRSAVRLDSLSIVTSRVTKDIVTTVIIPLSLAVVVFYFLTKRIIGPLEEIIKFAKEIADGNYKRRISMIREDEIGSLSKSLNDMAMQLDFSFTQLSERNAQLESVLSNINVGIIALNRKNEIIILNKSAMTLLDIPNHWQTKGKNILEVIRNLDFYKEIEEFNQMKNREFILYETQVKDKVVNIYSKAIYETNTNQGLIIVIEDISRIRKLENLRKDFVANVTHELKTPITSIKGFIETLLYSDVKDEGTRDKFYHIMETEVERLIHLVEDILTLSSLDSLSNIQSGNIDKIDSKSHLENIVQLMEKSAKDKEISISLEVEEDMKPIAFNANYFKQVIINLIDNAIKYSNPGGYIMIKAYGEGENAVIEIKDKGIGIPKEDQVRIFERFYRVDKGRSRQEGGTGLGLAIVKHMVQLQNSSIKVESQVKEGSTFTLNIPHSL